MVSTRVRGRTQRFAAAVALAAAVVLYAWWATGLEAFSIESTVAVVGTGVGAMAWGTWRRQRSSSRVSRLDAARGGHGIWLLLLALLTVWQLQAFVQSPRDDHPTISSLVNSALETDAARTGACVVWLLGAYRLGRREPAVAEPVLQDTRRSEARS